MIKKGSFVRISKVVLDSSQRATSIPEDTQKTNLKMWTKGILQSDANIGEEVSVKTLSDRVETGLLESVNHVHEVNYGRFVEEIFEIGVKVKGRLYE